MIIDKLFVQQFRNYESQLVNLSPGLNILYGNNAQGKTNLLEAIYCAAMGGTFKNVPDRQMIRIGSEAARVRVRYQARGVQHINEVFLPAAGRKKLVCDGLDVKKASELVGRLRLVLFIPADMELVTGGPAARRRFMDQSISQLRPRYLYALSRYQKVLEQKNKLLKSGGSSGLLDVWNEELAQTGGMVMWYRKSFLTRLGKIAAGRHREISGGAETLHMEYFASIPSPEDKEMKAFQEALRRELEINRNREGIMRASLIGPHRDDVALTIGSLAARGYASQGQQRTLLLTLKLSQMDLFREETGENPVLLLDDIAGELDAQRLGYLFGALDQIQVVVTCTQKEQIKINRSAAAFRVANGRIEE